MLEQFAINWHRSNFGRRSRHWLAAAKVKSHNTLFPKVLYSSACVLLKKKRPLERASSSGLPLPECGLDLNGNDTKRIAQHANNSSTGFLQRLQEGQSDGPHLDDLCQISSRSSDS